MTPRVWLCLGALSVAMGAASAEEPAARGGSEPLQFEVRLLSVPATTCEALQGRFRLRDKKPTLCDEHGLFALLEAIQDDPGANVLCSPRLVTAPGQPAMVQLHEGDPNGASLKLTITPTAPTGGRTIEFDLQVHSSRPGGVENDLKKRLVLPPNRTAILPAWWEETKTPGEPCRVIVCVSARPTTK